MKKTGLILVLVFVSLWTFTCKSPGYNSKKVVYVNSYHRGFPPSDQITAGVIESLPADSFEVVAFFMDTKRNPTEQYIKERVAALLDSIRMEEPDILILSDDNAVKYLAVPHARDLKIPIVFCGVNWTADQYELPAHQVTGVLELLPVKDLLLELKSYFPDMKKVLVLNEHTTTSRKTVPLLDTLLGGIGMEVHQELVDDFATWKSVFTRANESYDAIYLQTRGAIRGWDHKEALRHIHRDIQVPLITCEEFMMPYAVFGLTQLSKEQGILAAEQVKSILNGASPSDMPVTSNSMSELWFNPGLAEKIGFKPEKELLDKATLID